MSRILSKLWDGKGDLVEILRKLDVDDHYYGAFGKKFISNSDIGKLLNDPRQFQKPTEETTPLILGKFFHQLVLEPEKIPEWEILDVASRNTKVYRDWKNDKGHGTILRKEADRMTDLAYTLTNIEDIDDLLRGAAYEVPSVTHIDGIPFKGKADAVNHKEKLIIDVKTTSDIDGFRFSAKKYNYDSQAFIYRELFGYEMVFVVIDKNTAKVGLFDCSPEFYERGAQKVEDAIDVIRMLDNPSFDIEQWYIREILT